MTPTTATPSTTATDPMRVVSILLGVTGAGNLFTGVMRTLDLLSARALGTAISVLDTAPHADPMFPDPQDRIASVVVITAVFALAHFAAGIVQLLGWSQLSARKSFAISVVAAVSALAPFSCLSVLSTGVGVWALVALFQPGVRASFAR